MRTAATQMQTQTLQHETQLLKHRHKCCNSGDDEDGQGLSLMAIGYEAVKVDNTHKDTGT
jgi:hypothetical protein